MNKKIILSILCLCTACSIQKKTESDLIRFQYHTDSLAVLQIAHRNTFDRMLVREFRLSVPDSLGKQYVEVLSETRRIRSETDSLRLEQVSIAQQEEKEFIRIRDKKSTAVPSVKAWWIVCIVLIVIIFIIKRANPL